MRIYFVFAVIFFQYSAFAQSPSLSVRLQIKHSSLVNYKIDMKICKPVKATTVSDYFNNEISAINFKSLSADEISCENYITSYDDSKPFNGYYYSNQLFAWEKILIWRITNVSSRLQNQCMYIILPIKLKSFVTTIQISDIQFQTGKFIWIDETGIIDENKHQLLKASLKNKKPIPVRESNFKNVIN